jgi:hypothetical protein
MADGGDACDTNIDNDASLNSAEWVAGSLAHDSTSIPEVLNGIDDDDDGAQDEPTNTAGSTGLLIGTSTQPGFNPVLDRDGDGWNDDKEDLMGTGDRAPCGTTGLQWPGDFPPPEGNNGMGIGDINSFLVPAVPDADGNGTFAKYNQEIGGTYAVDRWRLDAGDLVHANGTKIGIGDINSLTAATALTARPPMFGGALKSYVGGASGGKAFFGTCPFP